jgi:hypothetical protein
LTACKSPPMNPITDGVQIVLTTFSFCIGAALSTLRACKQIFIVRAHAFLSNFNLISLVLSYQSYLKPSTYCLEPCLSLLSLHSTNLEALRSSYGICMG